MRKNFIYEKYFKRVFDVICSISAIIFFGWLYILIAVLVKIKLGSPVLFKQPRPGIINPKTGKEKIFYMYKFRTMTDGRDKNGRLLSDEERLTAFGKKLRATSLDELPEAFNILKGDMSVIGPRPQLVRDMVFMNKKQRIRHIVKPGLSGLAQVNGRNAVDWEDKFKWDLRYVKNISLLLDLKIIIKTVKNVFGKNESSSELDITDDYGDYLLKNGKISKQQYDVLQEEAKRLLRIHEGEKNGKI